MCYCICRSEIVGKDAGHDVELSFSDLVCNTSHGHSLELSANS